MIDPAIQTYLPTLHQKMAAGVLAILGILWIIRLMRCHKLKEEHALLWLVALVGISVVVFFDPILISVASLLGTKVPASALLLLTIFFLFIVCVWLTSLVSVQKRQLSKLMITVSILRERVDEIRRDRDETDSSQQ